MVRRSDPQSVSPGSTPGCHKFFILILGRGAFRKDINDRCILCKDSDNSQEHVINDCAKTEKLRAKLKKELNDLEPVTKNNTILESIFYWYYSKDLSDKRGARHIKRIIFIFSIKYEPLRGTIN